MVILRAVTTRKKNSKIPTTKRSPSFEPEVAAAVGIVARRYREAADIAQDAFALEAGVDRSYYGKLERGERQPSLGVFLRVAVTLQVSGAELMREVEAILSNRRRSEASELAAARRAVASARAQFAHQRELAGNAAAAVRGAALRAVARKAQERAAAQKAPTVAKKAVPRKKAAAVAAKPVKAAAK